MERTIGVLEEFSRTCSRYPVAGIYTAATSAVREASNGADFVRRVKERAGLDVEVISGDEEARLTMLGVSSGLDIEGKDVLLMDIGGGSTEFVSVSKGEISFKVSTDIGVVRFTEQYIHSDPPESGEIEALELAIKKQLGTLPVFFKIKNTGSVPEMGGLIGTAGTVTTLAAIEQKM
ncbi:MAG: Ppx/GppA family phosphatase, partial [Nitrospirae bacterium]|nr:Ppx/GppA family phosphatase [Nitrospirota bacterium]